MDVTASHRHDDGVLERSFALGEIPGTLWTPAEAGPAPLVLLSHNNGLPRTDARLVARARFHAARYGFAVVTIDAPECGDRPRSPDTDRVRAELMRARQAGEPLEDHLEALVAPLVAGAVPDWRATLDAVLDLPGIGPAVGYTGWAALGLALALAEPRVAAIGLFLGGYVPAGLRARASEVGVPALFLLQWDDEGNPRERALDLFDALGSREKTLHANPGGHLGTPAFELDDSCRFLARHLRG
ncbi:MAG: hypothetical protein U0Q15_15450 [Kineosporiaceae bacterium]